MARAFVPRTAAGQPVDFADGGQARYNLVYATVGAGRDLALDLFQPPAPRWTGPRPLVIYIHGGAFALMGKEGWLPIVGGIRFPRSIFADLVDRGYAVASLDYRLSGEAQFPLPLHDVKAGVRWLRAHAEELNLDPHRFAAWGESAGGWFSAMLATTGDLPALEGDEGLTGVSSSVQAAVDWYGPTDFMSMDSQAVAPIALSHGVGSPEAAFLGCPPTQCPELSRTASPLSYVSPATPPMLIQHGSLDHIVPPGQSTLLDRALTAVGAPHQCIIYPLTDHGFLGAGTLNPTTVLDTFHTFLDTHLDPTH
ncbi:alpha/beta hydrolase [Nocardia sp. NPDC051981]|uniref:alpha/beta hydrolase n=1 Tax=Nocardia sp. NPDC051981 TaxID=3155417 RepID=UPI00342294C3